VLQGAIAFATMLETNTKLRMLDLGGCEIGVHGLLAISGALANHNSTLESVGLEDCRVMSPPQTFTTRSMAQMFAENETLKQVYLSKHALRDSDFEV
jgi:Leucine Rich repeat